MTLSIKKFMSEWTLKYEKNNCQTLYKWPKTTAQKFICTGNF
jgi:hypothetical protein